MTRNQDIFLENHGKVLMIANRDEREMTLHDSLIRQLSFFLILFTRQVLEHAQKKVQSDDMVLKMIEIQERLDSPVCRVGRNMTH
jgi:hypothetical protein